MILVGNSRGGAANLSEHLLKPENDHVEVHELRGFASDNLAGALSESYAISRGTRCKQFLYSLSINPPPGENVSTAEFEETINRVEIRLGLTGQPRAIVFHEKAGADGISRRHAHCVWSRIMADEMKAVQISHDHHKLTALSRELYLEHPHWRMPNGLMSSSERDVRNFTLEDWQKAKRSKSHPHEIGAALQDCWAVSDSKESFMQALATRGFKLARGDRRNFVAVDLHGEPYAVARYVKIRTAEVRARLGELEESFPSVEQRKQEFAQDVARRLGELRTEEERKAAEERERSERERKALIERQRIERAEQLAALQARSDRETAMRQARYNSGWRKMVDRFTGRQRRVREQNIAETHQAILRDRAEKDELIFRHMEDRRALSERAQQAEREIETRKAEISAEISKCEEFARVASPEPPRERTPGRRTSRAPPEPSRPMQAPSESSMLKDEFAKASQPDASESDHDAKREAFIRKRQEQAARRGRDRAPRHDLER